MGLWINTDNMLKIDTDDEWKMKVKRISIKS